MAELLKDLKFLFKEFRWAWEDFRLLRKQNRRASKPPVMDKLVVDQRPGKPLRSFSAPVESPWPKNIDDILNKDGTPKAPWKEM